MTDVLRANIEALLARTLSDVVHVVHVTEPIQQADRNTARFTVIFEVNLDPRS